MLGREDGTPSRTQEGSVDRTLIRAALRRTPRQRFEAAVDLYRMAVRLRSAQRVSAQRATASNPH